MAKENTRAVVLAAGKSSRFKRKQSKLLTKICGRPMLLFPLKLLENLQIPKTVVIGHQADIIEQEIKNWELANVNCVEQGQRLGTGHAVLCSNHTWDKENILILNGDVPLLTEKFISKLLAEHEKNNADLSFVVTHMVNPKGYGRVIEKDGKIRIYEQEDCPPEYINENKVNAGIYLIKKSCLSNCISKLKKSESSGEFYITDLVGDMSEQGLKIQTIAAPFDEVRGVNTLQELWAAEQVLRSKLIKHWMNNGVRFELAQSIHLDIDVEIGSDSFIGTGAHILGNTKIGEGCFIAAFTILENTIVGDETNIHSHSVIQDSVIGKRVHVGPFARLRNNVTVLNNACVGNFVEVKNSVIQQSSKVKHLAYIGDATIGQEVNIGAGTIICNYDGQQKHKTEIEKNAFVGSNSTLIAPVKIGKDAYVAAGSTITKDVPTQDLAIARARQENKSGYAKKLRKTNNRDEIVENKNRVEAKKEMKFNFLGAVKTRTEESL